MTVWRQYSPFPGLVEELSVVSVTLAFHSIIGTRFTIKFMSDFLICKQNVFIVNQIHITSLTTLKTIIIACFVKKSCIAVSLTTVRVKHQ